MQLNDAMILIAEDEVGLLGIFKKWFEREGCRVFTAGNGLEALEILKTQAIDLIISDVRMPKMDGIEMAKRVNETRTDFPKIIFVSGFPDISDRECCDLGIEFMWAKPLRRESLVSAARTCLTDRDLLWRQPSTVVAERSLDAVFVNLADARAQGLIAFGHGGFCVRSSLALHAGQTIALNVEFTSDLRDIIGQGIVRWAVREEKQVGIEITNIDFRNRAWLVDLSKRVESRSFIPRSSAAAASLAVTSVAERGKGFQS